MRYTCVKFVDDHYWFRAESIKTLALLLPFYLSFFIFKKKLFRIIKSFHDFSA